MSSDEVDIDSIDEDEDEDEEMAVKPKRRAKKKKAKKDPNRPKRNMSSFFLYSNANRERIKEENPEAKFGDIVSVGCVYDMLDRRMARFLSGTIKLFSSSVYDTRGLRSAMMY